MFINFKKYTFQECMERLKKEVETVYNSKKSPSTTDPHKPPPITEPPENPNDNKDDDKKPHENDKPTNNHNEEKVLKWSEGDVEKWLESKSINTSIVENLKPCDGKILFQMYRILQSAPEFFYCAMKAEADYCALKDLALFVYELTALFK